MLYYVATLASQDGAVALAIKIAKIKTTQRETNTPVALAKNTNKTGRQNWHLVAVGKAQRTAWTRVKRPSKQRSFHWLGSNQESQARVKPIN